MLYDTGYKALNSQPNKNRIDAMGGNTLLQYIFELSLKKMFLCSHVVKSLIIVSQSHQSGTKYDKCFTIDDSNEVCIS